MKTKDVPPRVDEIFVAFNDEPGTANGKVNGHAKKAAWRDHVFTAAELQRKTFPQISYCVPDLIPEGLTIIAASRRLAKAGWHWISALPSQPGEFA